MADDVTRRRCRSCEGMQFLCGRTNWRMNCSIRDGEHGITEDAVLVLGVTDGIGRETAQQLRQSDRSVRRMHRSPRASGSRTDGIEWIQGDVMNFADVAAPLRAPASSRVQRIRQATGAGTSQCCRCSTTIAAAKPVRQNISRSRRDALLRSSLRRDDTLRTIHRKAWGFHSERAAICHRKRPANPS